MSEPTTIIQVQPPTRGQVVNALQQWLNDHREDVLPKLAELVTAAVKVEVATQVSVMLRTDKYDKMILNEIVNVVGNERKAYDKELGGNGYGFYHRIRDLVNQKIQALVLENYTVTVTPKPKGAT